MRVVIAKPGERAYMTEIEPGLASLQAVVAGDIELWAVDGAANFLCNDEGRINGLSLNRVVTLSDGTVWDIYGPILVVGMDDAADDFGDLPESEARQWVERLNQAILHRVVL